MKILIFSGGKAPALELFKKELSDNNMLICVDCGANYLHKNNIIPDILLGDFDSISKESLNFFKSRGCSIITYPPEKDYTDSELALFEALKFNPSEITFLGCTGTRVDHMLGNLGLLDKCLKRGIKASIKDDNNKIILTNKSLKLIGKKGDIFSIHAYCDSINNLTIEGAKYPLNNYCLKLGDSITISNEFLDSDVYVRFSLGKALIIFSND